MKKLFVLLLLLIFMVTLRGQLNFTLLDLGFPEVYLGDAVWSDFNNNGHLDLLISGYTYGTGTLADPLTKVYRNEGDGTFTDMEAGLFDLAVSKSVAGDLNNNGFNDIVMFGFTGLGGQSYLKMYMNNGDETFTEIVNGIPDLYRGDLALADFNNNGLLDILIAGEPEEGAVFTRIYLNNGDFTFTDLEAGLIGLSHCGVAAGDLNNNGWTDFVITGRLGSFDYVAYIYMNNGDGTFSQSAQTLIGLRYSSVSLGDYNNNGYLDILMNGSDNIEDKFTVIYRNNGDGTFTDINAGIIGTRQGSVAWGDFNNNGLLDFLVTGEIEGGWTTKLYLQTGTDTFTDYNLIFTNARRSTVVPGDYNNDGKLDFLLIGWAAAQDYLAEIYRNEIPSVNNPASAPTGLFTTLSDYGVQLHWEQPAAGTTPANGLTYNIRIGGETGGFDIVAPMADLDTGFRRVQELGKYPVTSALIFDLPEGVYYWSVQAIDHCFAGSPFSSEHIFTIGDIPDPTDPPILLLPPDGAEDLATNVHLQWEEVDNAAFFTVEVAVTDDFADPVYSHNLALTSYWLSSLDFETTYYWRVNSNNGVFPGAWSEVRSFETIDYLPAIDNLTAEVVEIDNVHLSWQVPVSRRAREEEISGFQLYRNGNLLVTIDDPEAETYSDEGLNNGNYQYHITVLYGLDTFGGLYESLPSNQVEITVYLYPPQNLTAESGDGYVNLFWEEPNRANSRLRELLGYNVYRNNTQINTAVITEDYYQDEDVTNGVLYHYHIRTVYSGGLSEPSNTVSIAPAIPALYPPRNLTAEVENEEIHLQWYSYLDGEWISWDNGMNSGGIGTNNPVQFEVAARFEQEDLLPYDGQFLKFVSFVPRQVQCLYSIRVWINGSVSGDDYIPGDLVVDQLLETADLVMQGWNVMELNEPVLINSSQELWIGYHIDTETGYPAGRDAGPAVANKGDLVNLDGWESLSLMNPNLNYNWNIQGYILDSGEREVNTLRPLSYIPNKTKRAGSLLSDQQGDGNIRFDNIFRTLSGYNVYRNGNVIEQITDPQIDYYIDIPATTGVYHYYVTALYGEHESPQSNIQTVIYTDIEQDFLIPESKVLLLNYPNPFNPETMITFTLPNESKVELDIFNIKGQHVVSLLKEILPEGEHSIIWNGKDELGFSVSSGVYLCRLANKEKVHTKRMLLLK